MYVACSIENLNRPVIIRGRSYCLKSNNNNMTTSPRFRPWSDTQAPGSSLAVPLSFQHSGCIWCNGASLQTRIPEVFVARCAEGQGRRNVDVPASSYDS
jgi:hypothetical protein